MTSDASRSIPLPGVQDCDVFAEGVHVKSPLHGYGRVVEGGVHPVVQFVDGQVCRVRCDDLLRIPDAQFWAVVRNAVMWEVYLHVRVAGLAPLLHLLIEALRKRQAKPTPGGFSGILGELAVPERRSAAMLL